MGSQYGPAGRSVGVWSESESDGPRPPSMMQLRRAQKVLQPNVRVRDAHDLEYDQGRSKHKPKSTKCSKFKKTSGSWSKNKFSNSSRTTVRHSIMMESRRGSQRAFDLAAVRKLSGS